MKKTRQEIFETSSIPSAFFALTLPAVLGKIISLFYNIADTWFMASTDDAALVAAVSLCGPLISLIVAMGDLFGVGGSSVVSRLLGERKEDAARKVSAFCFYGAALAGIVAGVILWIFEDSILRVLGADVTTLHHAKEYYRYIAIGAPVLIAQVVPLNLLRTEAMAKESMFGSVLGSIVHLIVLPIFIFQMNMGAAGAGLATLLGNASTLLYYIFCINQKAQVITVSPKAFTLDKENSGKVIAIGIPASLNNLMASLGTAICNRYLLLYGSDKIAAMGIASKVSMISMMMIIGFTFSTGPLIGYTYGKKDVPKLKAILKFFYSFQIGMSTAVSAVLFLFAPTLVAFFMDDPGIITAGTQILRWSLAGMPFMAIVMVSTCVFQSTGHGKAAMTISLCRQGVVYLAVITVANMLFQYQGVIAAQCIADILSATIAGALLYRELGKELNIHK